MKRSIVALSVSMLVAGTAAQAHAQSASSPASLARLTAQVQLLTDALVQVAATTARQQQAIAELKKSNDLLVSKLACVASTSGTRDFVFNGCNVHVQNGAGTTRTVNQYGNLIIGYNKNEVSVRSGSHNLVVGDLHEYTSYGGIVSGEENTLAGPNATVLSSIDSLANSIGSVLVGANRGVVDAPGVIVGGSLNYLSADAGFGVVIGGDENRATSGGAVAVGGTLNEAAGGNSLACGGSENRATGGTATACGGSGNLSQSSDGVVVGGSHNISDGRASLVSGGYACSTGGVDYKWVVGLPGAPGGCSANAN